MWSGYVQLPPSPAKGLAKQDHLEGQVISHEGRKGWSWRNTLLYDFKSRRGDQARHVLCGSGKGSCVLHESLDVAASSFQNGGKPLTPRLSLDAGPVRRDESHGKSDR